MLCRMGGSTIITIAATAVVRAWRAGQRAVQRRGVIPQQQVAFRPFVSVDEARLAAARAQSLLARRANPSHAIDLGMTGVQRARGLGDCAWVQCALSSSSSAADSAAASLDEWQTVISPRPFSFVWRSSIKKKQKLTVQNGCAAVV